MIVYHSLVPILHRNSLILQRNSLILTRHSELPGRNKFAQIGILSLSGGYKKKKKNDVIVYLGRLRGGGIEKTSLRAYLVLSAPTAEVLNVHEAKNVPP